LWLDAGRRFVFQYDPAWLVSGEAVPLSLGLPLQADPFEDDRLLRALRTGPIDIEAEADDWDRLLGHPDRGALERDAKRGLVSSQARRRAEDEARTTIWDRISAGVL